MSVKDNHMEQQAINEIDIITQRDKKVYEIIARQQQRLQSSVDYHGDLLSDLKAKDETVYDLMDREYERQKNTIQLIAGENQCSRAVLAALGSVIQNKTAEGFPGSREHGGCEVVDELESLAVERAKQVFGARYVNVQPHSGTSANLIVMTAVLNKNDKVLSMNMQHGGHYSHGSELSFTSEFFNTSHYGVDRQSYLLDYDAIRRQAHEVMPKLIICGASAYPRVIDFKKFRQIADEVRAYLLADISHISGLVAAGVHPSPVDHAHFVTTSTYKPGGPRGGLIIMGRDYERHIQVGDKHYRLCDYLDKMTFPGLQGTPYMNNVAAKAVFFNEMLSREYRQRQFSIVENARTLAESLTELGMEILTSGTDNHMMMIHVARFKAGLTGIIAQQVLDQCGIVTNRIALPYDDKPADINSGLRLGTFVVTRNGMGSEQMKQIAKMIYEILKKVEIISDREYSIDFAFQRQMLGEVKSLCEKHLMR